MQTKLFFPHHNSILKCGTSIAAIIFWHIFSGIHTITIPLEIPLCFYGATNEQKISAPETVSVILQGNRRQLSLLDQKTIAFHIDVQTLSQGTMPVYLTAQQLFLPDTIKLIHYTPHVLMVTLKK